MRRKLKNRNRPPRFTLKGLREAAAQIKGIVIDVAAIAGVLIPLIIPIIGNIT